ncbi:MAG: extracellular solute-binding protein [Defluviitaleaceae bacterium]|nr:extracellular solute-binding protein [Defluviitaleaceae bacterium]
MKKFKIIFTAAILATAMLFLAACGDDDTPAATAPAGGGTTETATAPATDAATTDDAAEEPAAPASPVGHQGIHTPRDLGGRTIRVSGWFAELITGVFTDDPDPATEDNYFLARLLWDNARRVEEQFNVNFVEFNIPYDDTVSVLTTSVMAGDPGADLQLLNGHMIMAAIMGDLIMPLDTLNLPGSDTFGAQIYSQPMTTTLGHTWSFADNSPASHGMGLGVNLNIINAIGAPNPVELYESGQWTWPAFLDIMRTATQDTTGNQVLDQFGIAGVPGDIAIHLVAANDGRMVDDDLNYGFDHPNTIEALEFVETIFVERLWQYDEGTELGDWGHNFNIFREGRGAFWPAVDWQLAAEPLAFDWTIVPFPLGPANTSGNTWSAGWEQSWTIPVGVENPEDILMIVEELFAWPGEEPELLMEGQLGWYRTIFNTEEDVQRAITSINGTMGTDLGHNISEYSWIMGTFISAFWNGTAGVAEVVEANRGPQQEMLDIALGR